MKKVFTYLVYIWSCLALVPIAIAPMFTRETTMTLLCLSGAVIVVAVCCGIISEGA